MKQLIEDLISMMEYHVEQTRPIHTTTVALQAAREALKSLSAQPAPVQEPVAQAWAEGYLAGINDERMSEANIGIAGMGMKVEPARNNPYRTTPRKDARWTNERCEQLLHFLNEEAIRDRTGGKS